jgi:hypothetical protein
MLRKLMVVAALALLPAAAAQAQFQAGDWALTLSGQGSNGPDFDGTQFSVNADIGYFLTKEFEVSLRQSIGYSDLVQGTAWNGSTRVAVDYNWDMGRWVPYIGANIGYVYGDGVNDSWLAGPEAGVKFFVNSTTYVQLGVEYQFFFDQGDDASEAFSDGQFLYSLGIGFRWH